MRDKEDCKECRQLIVGDRCYECQCEIKDNEILHHMTRIAKLEEVLRLIAAPKRADGTYNRCREACEQLARKALECEEM